MKRYRFDDAGWEEVIILLIVLQRVAISLFVTQGSVFRYRSSMRITRLIALRNKRGLKGLCAKPSIRRRTRAHAQFGKHVTRAAKSSLKSHGFLAGSTLGYSTLTIHLCDRFRTIELLWLLWEPELCPSCRSRLSSLVVKTSHLSHNELL